MAQLIVQVNVTGDVVSDASFDTTDADTITDLTNWYLAQKTNGQSVGQFFAAIIRTGFINFQLGQKLQANQITLQESVVTLQSDLNSNVSNP